MRYLFTLLVFLTPFLSPAAQSVYVNHGTFSVTSGVVDLGPHSLVVGESGTLDEQGGRVTVDAPGTLMVSPARTYSDPMSSMNVGGLGLTITTTGGNTPGALAIVRGHVAQTGSGNVSVLRYYDVSAETNTGLDASVVFQYDDAELNGLLENDLVLYGSLDGGASWIKLGGTVDTERNTVTASGLDGLMRLTVASNDVSLPVELVAFGVSTKGTTAVLQWETASETNNVGFAVEMREAHAPAWLQVEFHEGQGTTAKAQRYQQHVDGLAPGRYLFRLKQIDYDGAFAYSPEVEASILLSAPHLISPAAPNPFASATEFTVTVQRTQRVVAAAYDLLGRQLAQIFDGTMDAHRTHRITFDAAGLPAGLYVLRVQGEHFQASQTVTRVQ